MSSIGSLSGAINFAGLGSETDTGAMVDQLVEVERFQINRFEYWKTEWNTKIESIQGLNNIVQSLKDITDKFNEDFEFYARTSSTSDSSVLTVTNTPNAQPGAHTIEVASAVNHRFGSRGFAASTTVVSGTPATDLVIQVGSATVTVAYGANYAAGEWDTAATLADLATAINAADAVSNVLQDVKIIDDGSEENASRLVLTATDGGSDQEIVVVSDPTTMGLDGTVTVDSLVEETSGWTGTAALTPDTGSYNGTTNKRFTFEVDNSGTVASGASITISWTDNEGKTGSFNVSAAGDYTVAQGLTINFGAGNLVKGQSFALDAYNTTLQGAQDTGLAQVEQVTHGGFMDVDQTAVTTVAGSFDFRYNGTDVSILVEPGTTLEGLVTLINADSTNPGVTASIFDDGLGLATSKHLRLTGEDSGQAYQITNIQLTSFDVLTDDFTTTQSAQNSMFKVDGYPAEADEYIQRSDNQISDVIEGITLKLHSAGSANVTVENDISIVALRIEGFINATNDILDYIDEETKYDEETGEAGIMIGNYVFNLVEQQVKSIFTAAVPGLSEGTDTYTLLAQVGIHSDPDNQGRFTIEATELDEALNSNLSAVAALFMLDEDRTYTDDEGEEQNIAGVVELMRERTEALLDTDTGAMNVLIDNYQGIIDGIDDKIAREERRVALVESRLRERYARLESNLAVLNAQQESLAAQIDEL